jgi:hypothetical protein
LWHQIATNPAQASLLNEPGPACPSLGDPLPARLLADLSRSPIAIDLAARYASAADAFGYDQASAELQAIHASLVIGDLNLTASTEELRESAQRFASRCRNARQAARTLAEAHGRCSAIVERYRLTPPPAKPDSLEPNLNRMCCNGWWFRKIQTLRLRTLEKIARNIELVSRCRSIYASDHIVKLKRWQKEQNRLYLSSSYLTNEKGESFSLQELADRSVSNPAIRRAELMVRAKGFEIVAELVGHIGEFYTLTTPSRMHACRHDGAPNPGYDGTSPREAHEYLTHLWALIRAELHRQDIRPYGFRVVEPHHDGTPHWHLLLFMPQEHRDMVRDVMRRYALADNGDEPGAAQHRFKAVAIDPAKGSAAGYIAKYIAKNIDGYALDQDLHGKPANLAAEHITAWATTWGIRQFQQIGGPSVTVWRQLRRLAAVEDGELENIRQSATASDWAAYTLAQGGPEMPRRSHPIQPFYALTRRLDTDTGEIYLVVQGRYGDASPQRVAGLTCRGVAYDTRKHFWTLSLGVTESETRRSRTHGGDPATAGKPHGYGTAPASFRWNAGLSGNPRGLPSVQATRHEEPGADGEAPWTRINNCTDRNQGYSANTHTTSKRASHQ